MTSVVPALPVRARAYCVGNWKHSDLPAPVAATASTSRRAASACSTVFWKGLKDEWPKDAFSTASADSSSQEPVEEEEEEEDDILGRRQRFWLALLRVERARAEMARVAEKQLRESGGVATRESTRDS